MLCSGEIYSLFPKMLQMTVGAYISEPTSALFSRSFPHGTDRRAWQPSWRRDPLATLENKLGVKLPAVLQRVCQLFDIAICNTQLKLSFVDDAKLKVKSKLFPSLWECTFFISKLESGTQR